MAGVRWVRASCSFPRGSWQVMKGVVGPPCCSPTAADGGETKEGPRLEVIPLLWRPMGSLQSLVSLAQMDQNVLLELVEGAGGSEGEREKGVSAELCWIRPSAAHRILRELGSHGHGRQGCPGTAPMGAAGGCSGLNRRG